MVQRACGIGWAVTATRRPVPCSAADHQPLTR